MSVPFLDLQAQYRSLKEDIDLSIHDVLDSSIYILGPHVEAFEKNFAQYSGVKHCVAVNSGTAALELLLRAWKIGPGDEVITVANSFFASAEAISLVGATPILVDCNEDDALMDVRAVERAITSHTKAVIPVHLYGQCADMDPLIDLCKQHNVRIIEDACQAHGAMYKGKRAGSMGAASAFSFYPGKNLGAYGEGGALTTNDDEIAASMRLLRDHGMPAKYTHAVVGTNNRMDAMQGAVLGVKLPHLEQWNETRRMHAETYRKLLADIPGIKIVKEHTDRTHVYHLFVIRCAKRDALQSFLKTRDIQTLIHYPTPIHLQPAYSNRGWKEGDFPQAETLSKEILSLPMFPEMTQEQIQEVCTAIRDFTSGGNV